MAVIGLMGFLFDFTLRQVQHRMLWWIAPNGGAGR
jgi:NitT/TauT family transport system permease protein